MSAEVLSGTERKMARAIEAMERRAEIVEHGRKVAVQCGPTAD